MTDLKTITADLDFKPMEPGLPGFYEEIGHFDLPGDEKLRVGLSVTRSTIYLFTPFPHPQGEKGEGLTYVADLPAAINAAVNRLMDDRQGETA